VFCADPANIRTNDRFGPKRPRYEVTDRAEVESDRTSSLWPQKSAHQLKPSLGRPRLRSDGKTTFNGDFIAAASAEGREET